MDTIIKMPFDNGDSSYFADALSPEYQTAAEKLNPYLTRIKQELGSSFFESLYDALLELNDIENFYFFQKGVKIGGNLLLEIVDYPSKD